MHPALERRTAVALSGGAALGAAHIGVLRVLEEQNWTVDFLAGVSAGAIVAALIALGRDSRWIQQTLKEVDFFSLAFDVRKASYAFLRGDRAEKVLSSLLGEARFSDLAMPLVIGATDFLTGETVNITSGRIVDAVRASISIPVIFEPFQHPEENRLLVDGGLTRNLPLDAAAAFYQGDCIIAVDVIAGALNRSAAALPQKNGKTKQILSTAERALGLMILSQQTPLDDPRVLTIRPLLEGYHVTDVFRLDEIIERGVQAARLALAPI